MHPTTQTSDRPAVLDDTPRSFSVGTVNPCVLIAGCLFLLWSPARLDAAEVAMGPSPALNRCDGPDRTLTAVVDSVSDLLAYQVEISLDETFLDLPDTSPFGFSRGSFLGDSTFFFVEKLAEGSYRIAHTKLGLPGANGSGDLFELTGDPIAETEVDMEVSLVTIDARDGFNQTIDIILGDPAIVRVDCTAPAIGVSEADRSCFHGTEDADPLRAIIGASDAGGAGADLDRIDYQIVAGTGDCDPEGSFAPLLVDLVGTTYGPSDEELPDPPAGGQWTIYLRAADDAGNLSGCGGHTFLYLPDPPPPALDLTARSLFRGVELTWNVPGQLPGQEVWIVRKHWNNDGTSGYPQYLLDGALDGGDYPADLDDGFVVHTTTDGTSFVDEVGDITSEVDIYLYRAFVVDCLDAVNPGEAPLDISADFSEETLTDAVDAANNYWLGDIDDSAGDPYEQDGYVTAIDLAILSGSIGRIDGEAGFVPEADFGPSAMPTGSPSGVPRPDNQVSFEDLNLMAINYLATEPLVEEPILLGPNSGTAGDLSLHLRTFRASSDSAVLTAELRLTGSHPDLHGICADLSYDPANLQPIGGEASTAIQNHPGEAFACMFHRDGRVEVSAVTLGRTRTFLGSGPVYRVWFRISGPEPGRPVLDSVKLRDGENREIGTGGGRYEARSDEADLLWPRSLVVSKLEIGPNPFTQSTTIRLQLPEATPVEMTICDVSGRRVRDLANGRRSPGIYLLEWDGTDGIGRRVPAGVYYCDLRIETHRTIRKILYLR